MVGIKIRFYCDSSWLKESGYTIQQQAQIYDDLLTDIYNNPGWYLEHFRMMREFRVDWVDYKQTNITKPYKFVKNGGKVARKEKHL